MNRWALGMVLAVLIGGGFNACWIRAAWLLRRTRRERATARAACADLGAVLLRHNVAGSDAATQIHIAMWEGDMPAEVSALSDRMRGKERKEQGWSA